MKLMQSILSRPAAIFGSAVLSLATMPALALSPPDIYLEPLDFESSYSCSFPLIGTELVNIHLTSDAPDYVFSGQPFTYQINAEIEFSANTTTGYKLVNATEFSGTIDLELLLLTQPDIGVESLPVELLIEPASRLPGDAPFVLSASGSVDSMHAQVSQVSLRPGRNLSLNLESTKPDGSPTPEPLDRFTADCVSEDLPAAMLTVAPTELDFGKVVSGTYNNIEPVTIQNYTSETVYVSELSMDENGSQAFSLTGLAIAGCDELAPLDSCEVNVRYAPDVPGDDASTLSIVSTSGTFEVPVTGTSRELGETDFTVTPSNVDFGVVAPGETAASEVVITNTGSEFAGFGLAPEDDPNGDPGFSFEISDCYYLDPGESCTYRFFFTSSGYTDEISQRSVYFESTDYNEEPVAVKLSADSRQVDSCVVDSKLFDIVGEATLGAEQTKLSLIGQLEGGPACPEPNFRASVNLQPVPVKAPLFETLADNISMNLLWVPEPTFELTGTVTEAAGVSAQGEFQVLVHDVYISLFGLVKIPFGGGNECHPAEPVTIQLYSNHEQGSLEGTLDIGPFENCGLATSWINRQLSGAGNPVMIRPQ